MKTISSIALSASVIGSLAGAGCGTPTSTPDTATPSTFTDVKNGVIKISCVFSSCHNAASKQGGLDLETSPYKALVNAPTFLTTAQATYPVRVTPGDLTKSFLWEKVTQSKFMDAALGLKMPNTGQSLDATQLQIINSWITAGALDN